MTTDHERCTRCVLSSAFPKINFDEKGVCNFCRDEMYFTPEDSAIDRAKKQVEDLFAQRSRDMEYDAVMCYSGGKDSTYTLKLAVENYGLKVLAFTLDNGFISRVAFENMSRVVNALGVDFLCFKPSSKNMTGIIRASYLHPIYNKRTLTRISAGCNSCISMVNMYALKTAMEKNIPFIIAGFTLGQIPVNAIVYKNNYRFLEDSRKSSVDLLRQYAGEYVDQYFRIKEDVLEKTNESPHSINLLCLEDVTESEIVDNIKELGWVPPKDVDGCSSNCRLNTLNNHVHQLSFGYSPYELELSRLIRKGKMTREEALAKIKDQSDQQIVMLMEELSVTDEELAGLKTVYERENDK